MQKLYSAANLQEAYLILQMLAAAGIEATILNEHAHGGLGEIPFTHAYPEIWLMEGKDEARARRLVRDYEDTDSAATHACAACGEHNPSRFELCWRCGAPLPIAVLGE